MACAFCEEGRARRKCPYCEDRFCSAECLSSHYVGYPMCGEIDSVPADVKRAALVEAGILDDPADCPYCEGSGKAITSTADGSEYVVRCCCPTGMEAPDA